MKLIQSDPEIKDVVIFVDKIEFIEIYSSQKTDKKIHTLHAGTKDFYYTIYSSFERKLPILLKERLLKWLLSTEDGIFYVSIEKQRLEKCMSK